MVFVSISLKLRLPRAPGQSDENVYNAIDNLIMIGGL